MKIRMTTMLAAIFAAALIAMPGPGVIAAGAQATGTPAPTVLNREQSGPILPAAVFYRGQSAPVQARNSAGLKLPDGKLALFTMVDTSGYSSAVQETYQAYLLTEVALTIGDQSIKPGAYGFGFIAGDKMVVLDLGGNELWRTSTKKDAALARPNPLQILPDATGYRLYLGRSYVMVSLAAK